MVPWTNAKSTTCIVAAACTLYSPHVKADGAFLINPTLGEFSMCLLFMLYLCHALTLPSGKLASFFTSDCISAPLSYLFFELPHILSWQRRKIINLVVQRCTTPPLHYLWSSLTSLWLHCNSTVLDGQPRCSSTLKGRLDRVSFVHFLRTLEWSRISWTPYALLYLLLSFHLFFIPLKLATR